METRNFIQICLKRHIISMQTDTLGLAGLQDRRFPNCDLEMAHDKQTEISIVIVKIPGTQALTPDEKYPTYMIDQLCDQHNERSIMIRTSPLGNFESSQQ